MRHADIREFVEGFPLAILLVSREGDIIVGSQSAATLFGVTTEDLVNASLSRFSHLSPDKIIECLKPCGRTQKPVLAPLKLINHQTKQILSSKGCLFHKAVFDGDKRAPIILHVDIQGTLGASLLELTKQINKQKLLIGKLNQLNTELQRSNQELENFAYIASHDLRSPLRGIDQLASWLTEDLQEEVGKDSSAHLRLMRGRISRMEQLLDDILAYSKAGKLKGDVSMTDINQIVERAFDLLNTTPTFRLMSECPLPTIKVNSIPLEQVFRNLINNAVKHHDKATGQIGVRYTALKNMHQFEVVDDGPGIGAEYRDLVFTMFKTLRPRDEVEGSGMGLAIVKKIVEAQGGSIKVVDNKPRGARFIFTWPML